MKLFLAIFASFMLCSSGCFAATAEDAGSGGRHPRLDAGNSGDNSQPSQPRVSVFSTSTDWEGLTGLSYHEYKGKFITSSSLVGKGLVLYYLDGFPCYGLGYGVRVWLGPNNKHDGELRIACIYPPSEINFTWRNATRDADQAVSTGLLTCPVESDGRDLTINLSECKKGKDWKDIK